MTTRSIVFAFPFDWSGEVGSFERGAVPSHRLFGLAGVRSSARYRARLGSGLSWPVAVRARPPIWRVVEALAITARQRSTAAIVCTTETSARGLLVLRRIGLLRRPVVVVAVALTEPRSLQGPWHRFWRLVLPAADGVLVYASSQREHIVTAFGLDPALVRFVPFGVDTDYFSATERPEPEWDVVSVGTNAGKDYATLVKALPSGTKVCIVTDPANADIVRAHATEPVELRLNVPIAELRELYRSAAVIAIPLHDVEFSSGQTVLLENLSLGSAVCVTRTAAVRDYIDPGVTCIGIGSGDVDGWRNSITELLGDRGRREKLGAEAAAAVRSNRRSDQFAANLMDWVDELTGVRS